MTKIEQINWARGILGAAKRDKLMEEIRLEWEAKNAMCV